MRGLPILVSLAVPSASAALQFPFNIWPSGPQSTIDVTDASPSTRIAIIGAGAGGSSAAFWISKAKERHGLDIEVDIYDKVSYVGGRSTTVHPYDNASYYPVELGASVFVEVNKNLWRATNEFNLSRVGFEDEEDETGIWDGEKFVFTMGSVGGTIGSWLDNIKILWRYGFSAPRTATKLVKRMTDQFVDLYIPQTPRWQNISELVKTFEWEELVSTTGSEYFQAHGVSKQFTNELIEAATLVNYAQDVDSMQALECACSLAANGASSVNGGNWQIFENFVNKSGANLFLNTSVSSVQRKSRSQWTVTSDRGAANYQAVILSAPYHTSGIALPSELSDAIPKQPYIHLHVTLLTTNASSLNPEYFGLAKGAKVPTTVLTTLDGVRKGGKAPEFNSLNYLRKLKVVGEDGTVTDSETGEWLVKIFSMVPMSDERLAEIFQGQVGWVLRKEWDSYPVLPPTTSFPPIKLDRGLFYVNAFEPFISTMETETVAARNIVDWLLAEEYNASICGTGASSDNATEASIGAGKDFVYGWDC